MNKYEKFFREAETLNKNNFDFLGMSFSGIFMYGIPEEKKFRFTSLAHKFTCKLKIKGT